jgi:hypothetical protein
MHLIWLSAVLPAMLFAVWAFPAARDRRIWELCLTVALLGIAVLITLELAGFFPAAGHPHSLLTRLTMLMLTTTDLPVMAFAIGSLLNWTLSNRTRPSSVARPVETNEAANPANFA